MITANPTDIDAIRQIYPSIVINRDFAINNDGSLNIWITKDKRCPQPTVAQLAAAKSQIAALHQTIEQVRAGLLSQFYALTLGEQAFYQSVFTAVGVKLDGGDLNGAKQILATAPAPTPSLLATQASMVALFK